MSYLTIKQYWHVIVVSAEMVYRELARDLFVLFTIIIQPLIVAFMGLWMLQARGGDYAIFVVVGSGMTGLWSSLLFLCGNAITRDRWSGTLEMLIALPTPLHIIVLGRNVAFVIQSLLSMMASYLLAVVVLGYTLTIAQPIFFIISLLFTIISFICFGLMIAPIFLLNPIVQRFQNGLEFPVFILAGFLFPIALLPGWTTLFSYSLAPYWAARALHASAQGSAEFGSVAFNWAILMGLALAYVLISRWLFRISLYRARQEATLNLQ